MNKVNGKKASFAPIREDGSRITICYGLKKLSGDLYEWYEVYLPKKQTNALTIDIVKAAVIDNINNRVKNAIISGFVWNEKPVWLSEENQLNFFQSVAPCRLKIGEQEDGTAIYPAEALSDPMYRIHVVAKGDTLWGIAKHYLGNGSRYPEIKELNKLKSNTIYSGWKLKIPN